MIYIHTALKPEAQAVIEKFKLKKLSVNIFSNGYIFLIVSGVGNKKTLQILQDFIKNTKISDNECFINIGICASSNKYNIGDLIEISYVKYKGLTFSINDRNKETIASLDYPSDNIQNNIADMESYGFYQAVKNLKNVRMFKVVSDHFEPKSISKDFVKKLIFENIGDIIENSSCNWN